MNVFCDELSRYFILEIINSLEDCERKRCTLRAMLNASGEKDKEKKLLHCCR